MSLTSQDLAATMSRLSDAMTHPDTPAQARSLFSECWLTIAALQNERTRLRRGEFICNRCGLRKDDERPKTHEF